MISTICGLGLVPPPPLNLEYLYIHDKMGSQFIDKTQHLCLCTSKLRRKVISQDRFGVPAFCALSHNDIQKFSLVALC